ncbi:PRC-barrel domain-containing protein [Azospirillum agricola]|uniref:PRC-barrel domain-containing protein n=1 Tax=Azospirillum agricola TaxID=1720247 RepID=UPI000A0F260B|nr:PRC-barrel domain-containing protein [Azospirillum agricola]SMH43739.1 PRC-barrel domain-containing protein [Azospirillum lipoferum]
MKGILLAGCTAALLASSPVLAASSDHSVTHPTTPSVAALDDSVDPALLKMRVDQLKGKDIHGSDGKDMAEIEDIVRYNRQLFAVIDVDHTVDVSDKDVVLPLNKLRVKGDRLTLDMTKDQLQGLEKWQKDRYERVKEAGPLSELGR